ncbi:MAG TPA: IS1182 family transposase [Alphaproteobacteria bacterium]|jgi:transposase|nr:IS1182 family transposase [Alphaproteobacteria bacterium]
MMGRGERGQGQFFYAFDLDEVVPPDHLVRKIDAVLDLGWLHKELAPYYSHTGRPSIDPELLIRMLIVGYVFAIRSERGLCAEVQVNLAYRWFCGLGIEDRLPNHSVFSRARHERFRESEVLRCVFEHVVATCLARGLVGGEAFSIDASLIKADVDKNKRVPGDGPGDWPRSQEASRAVREYLAALDAARSDETEGDGEGSGGEGSAAKPQKAISLTDPQASWVSRKRSGPFFAYDANYLIDNKLGIIVDAEGSRANRTDEIAVAETMVARVERRFGLAPERIAGDTAYGAARFLKWLWDRGITPHVPVWDKSQQTGGRFTKEDFVFDRARNVYICPAGAELTHSGVIDQGRILPYRARKADCSTCALKPRCTTAVARKLSRDIDEDVRDHVRALANTQAFQISCRERKKVEVKFAHMKGIHKLSRLRLRGLNGAKDEVLLTATAQNLRRLAKLLFPAPPRPATRCAA